MHNAVNSILGDGPECYTMENGTDYRGQVATAYGQTCKEWRTLFSYQRASTDTHPDKGLGEHNYCRHPDGLGWGRAWCYTLHSQYGGALCDIGQPKPSCNNGMCILILSITNHVLFFSSNMLIHLLTNA